MTVAPADLAPVRGLARRLAHESWFAAVGEALTEGERAELALWLEALRLGEKPIERVASWAEAAAVAKRPDWSRAWWDAEEKARRALLERAVAVVGEAPLLAALTEVTEAAAAILHGAASVAAARAGIADPGLTRAAAGAAAQAAYQAALALAAAAGADHPFAVRYRLFAAGRWPLGVVGERCFVF